MKCSEIIKILETLSPRSMACDWDNPGLLAGRSGKEVKTIFLAVDATDSVIEQAEQAGADMILTHHPLIFKGIKQVSDQNFIGRRVLRMIQDDISYYAMHTNFDAAPGCMADLAAKKLGLTDCEVLEKMGETGDGTSYGIGCTGRFEQPMTLREAAEQVKEAFGLPYVAVFGELDGEAVIQKAAVCPGAGGSTMGEALAAGAQVYITGDISHHEGIDAVAQGMAVIDAGHYGIEHIFTEFMEKYLMRKLGDAVKVVRENRRFQSRLFREGITCRRYGLGVR